MNRLRALRDLFPRRFAQWVLGIVMLLVVAVAAAGFCSARSFPRCADFNTQREAQRAFLRGMTWLDLDKDRLACETLP